MTDIVQALKDTMDVYWKPKSLWRLLQGKIFKRHFEKRIYIAHLQFRAAPAKLPEFGMQFENGDEMQVSGWGTTSSGGSSSDELRIVTVPFVSDDGRYT